MINELSSEIGARVGLGCSKFCQDREELVGISPVGRNEPVYPEVGDLMFPQLGQSAGGEILNALNQCDAQHLGYSPEFANRQRAHGLIGLNKCKDVLPV